MGHDDEEEFNYGSEFDRYVPPSSKVYKLSSNVPENLTASFQNLLNKRINDNYKVRKNQNLIECFAILKFTILFIIFITTCKIITLFFSIDNRVDQYNGLSPKETVRIGLYSIFTIALLVQLIETYAIVFDKLCLTYVFTCIEFVIIMWAILDCYHSKDEHWLIYLWAMGLGIFMVHLVILYKIKGKPKHRTSKLRRTNTNSKELNSESNLYLPQKQDCSYSDFLTQKQYENRQATAYAAHQQPGYVQTTINLPTIITISESISSKRDDDDGSTNVDTTNLVKFVNDEEEAHEQREKLCKELLRQCQMKIYHLEMSQCNNQLMLDKKEELEQAKQQQINDICDGDCALSNSVPESNQTSEFNSPKSSSSCSDETCREASQAILNVINSVDKCNHDQ